MLYPLSYSRILKFYGFQSALFSTHYVDVNLRNLWKMLLFSSLRQKEQKTLR